MEAATDLRSDGGAKMKKIVLILPIIVLMTASLTFGQLEMPGADNTPTVGEKAPEFKPPKGLMRSEPVGLADFAGKQRVLVTFYAADWTGG